MNFIKYYHIRRYQTSRMLHDRITHFVVVTMFMSGLIPQRQKRETKLWNEKTTGKTAFILLQSNYATLL